MKPLPLVLFASCVFVAACTQHRPPPRRPVPSPNPLPPAAQPAAIRPALQPTATPSPAQWPVRLAPAFRPDTLPERLTLSPAQITEMRDDIRRWLAAPLLPDGEEVSLYSSSVTTLDHWLHYGPIPSDSPPTTPTYYEMVHRDGYPTEVYRHEAGTRKIRQRVYYAENLIPVCSVSYGQDDQPAWFAHLTYEPSGLIRHVVVLDARGEPARGVCFAHEGVYARTEKITYDLKASGKRSTHSLNEGDVVYRIEPDGSRTQVNRGAKLWWLTRLSSFGVKPLYPLPPGFVVPQFDRRGTVSSE